MATVADAWRPTSELEHRLQETVRAGDQESYFRLLADSELVVPVPPEAVDGVLAGEAQPSWPTQEEDGRVHVLVYTSASAMRACMGPSYQHFMTVRFGDIAETWPDSRWWLAIDAPAHGVGTVLPIEARMPSWFIRQVAEGDGRPPQVGRVAAPWEELRDQHRDLPRETSRTEFQPANDVERDLLRAASTNDHDLFLQTLAGTEVLLPVPDDLDFSLRPGRPGFPWQTREVDGATVVPVFTSPERLTEAARAAGTGTEFITLPFTVVLRYWPNHDWLLAINSGSPAGGTVLAQQLPGLATWADQRAAQRMADRFEPQNDIEQRLLDAARRRDTDGFFKILLGAQVLVPADTDTPWGIVPGDAEFPWRPVPVHGRTSIQLFTSLKWMNEALGTSRFIMPSLLEMVSAWPDTNWTLVLNPGTPIDASMPGDQVRTLRGPATPPSASTPPPPEAPAVPVAPAVPSTDPAPPAPAEAAPIEPAQATGPVPAAPGGTGRHSGPSSDPQALAAAPTPEAPPGPHAAPQNPAPANEPTHGTPQAGEPGGSSTSAPSEPFATGAATPAGQVEVPGPAPSTQGAAQNAAPANEPRPSGSDIGTPNLPPQATPSGQEQTPGHDPATHGTPQGAAPVGEPGGSDTSAPNVPPQQAPQEPQPSEPFASSAGIPGGQAEVPGHEPSTHSAPETPTPASEPAGSGTGAPNVPPQTAPSGQADTPAQQHPNPQNAPQEPQPSEPTAGLASTLGGQPNPPEADPDTHSTPQTPTPASEPSGGGTGAPNVPPQTAPSGQADTPAQQHPNPQNAPQEPQPSEPTAGLASTLGGQPNPPRPTPTPTAHPKLPRPPTSRAEAAQGHSTSHLRPRLADRETFPGSTPAPRTLRPPVSRAEAVWRRPTSRPRPCKAGGRKRLRPRENQAGTASGRSVDREKVPGMARRAFPQALCTRRSPPSRTPAVHPMRVVPGTRGARTFRRAGRCAPWKSPSRRSSRGTGSTRSSSTRRGAVTRTPSCGCC
ncbi:SseB family protein [Actinomadura madurae]|uniref:SseB family protein n=1 Tax=Actinomadura madurae TaxID=1993 RepID=UPI000D9D1A67|nr:SseB family protein [Actinomadura madurae]SPT50116.1 Uncharacterised protein [Actinomadura madurae]